MAAILRNNAISQTTTGRVGTSRGGGGGVPTSRIGPVKRRAKLPADPAAELMPAAEFLGSEPDFGAILEDFADSPFNPARRRVLGRLMGMFAADYQGARREERRFLRRLLKAGNAREGYAANRALHLCGAPPLIRRTLALGVAEARSPEGAPRGFLGAVQARVAATTFQLLGPRGRAWVWDLLGAAGHDSEHRPLANADRILERALILKALAARRHRLGPWSREGEKALAEVAGFAAQIRGRRPEVLAVRTTLVPIDPARAAPALATQTDAGARAGYLARGEIDPCFAWGEHGEHEAIDLEPGAAAPDDALGELDHTPFLERPRLHQALAESRAFAPTPLDEPMREALADYLAGQELSAKRLARKDAALAIFAARAFDVAGEAVVEAIRRDAQGASRFDAARALGDLLCRYTGAAYVRRVFSDELTAGGDPLAQIRAALARGMPVPVLVNELKLGFRRALVAAGEQVTVEGGLTLELCLAGSSTSLVAKDRDLLAPVLPAWFGKEARADSYLAPAALDLLAPPFGIPFPQLGIEDRL